MLGSLVVAYWSSIVDNRLPAGPHFKPHQTSILTLGRVK